MRMDGLAGAFAGATVLGILGSRDNSTEVNPKSSRIFRLRILFFSFLLTCNLETGHFVLDGFVFDCKLSPYQQLSSPKG